MFRPRYSLLSLLVVTALVAAGVMYFRVPHRALVSNPPTDEERWHLERSFVHRGFVDLEDKFKTEYEYFNTWRGQRWVSLVSKPRDEYFVTDTAGEINGKPAYLLLPQNQYKRYYEQFSENGERTFQFERVVVVVMSGEKEPPRPPEPVTNANGTTIQLPTFAFSTVGGACPGIYFVTESQRIFQITMSYPFLALERLELSQIPDEHVRRRVEEELSKIAQDQ